MKRFRLVTLRAITAALALIAATPVVWAKAVVSEFELITEDYNNCTDEMQAWDAVVRQVEMSRETPSGRGVYVNIWVWEGTVEGLESGYVWRSRGTAPYVERYALDGSPAGGFFVLENSVLHPVTAGAPRIRLDVVFRMAYNANGDLVVDQAGYTYHCP